VREGLGLNLSRSKIYPCWSSSRVSFCPSMEIPEYILYLQLDEARFLQHPSQFNIPFIHRGFPSVPPWKLQNIFFTSN
jgi:hypothetical protein